jgi:hypothetical protein
VIAQHLAERRLAFDQRYQIIICAADGHEFPPETAFALPVQKQFPRKLSLGAAGHKFPVAIPAIVIRHSSPFTSIGKILPAALPRSS